jgi:hypothetical protein
MRSPNDTQAMDIWRKNWIPKRAAMVANSRTFQDFFVPSRSNYADVFSNLFLVSHCFYWKLSLE